MLLALPSPCSENPTQVAPDPSPAPPPLRQCSQVEGFLPGGTPSASPGASQGLAPRPPSASCPLHGGLCSVVPPHSTARAPPPGLTLCGSLVPRDRLCTEQGLRSSVSGGETPASVCSSLYRRAFPAEGGSTTYLPTVRAGEGFAQGCGLGRTGGLDPSRTPPGQARGEGCRRGPWDLSGWVFMGRGAGVWVPGA